MPWPWSKSRLPKPVASASAGQLVTTSQQLEDVLRVGLESLSGEAVTTTSAMRVATVFGCVALRSGCVANMPIDIMRRLGDSRVEAIDHPLWLLLKRRPNRWQSPSQLKRMLEAHVQLRGNAYARIVRVGGRVIELIPLHPDRVEVKQLDDLSVEYHWTRKDGTKIILAKADVLHLAGLSLDGITGLSPLSYARDSIGDSLAMARHGSNMFRNGAQVSGVFTMDGELSETAHARLKAGLDDYRSQGNNAGKALILENGLDYKQLSLTAVDAQWMEARKFTRTDIAMIFGVPPFMLGDTEKSTSWGTGLEQQVRGFLTFHLETSLTMWEEAINCQLIADRETDVYARFNRNSLLRGDSKTRWENYVKGLQWGVISPDEVRAHEDLNPRGDGDGGQYYSPPNTAGRQNTDQEEQA